MKRRDFLKGAAGLVISCGLGFSLDRLIRVLSPGPEDAVGPLLAEGLTVETVTHGADVYVRGLLAFQVNHSGNRLLRYADGRHTLARIITLAQCEGQAAAAAAFFITLGQAGYLQNKIEVNLVEARA